MPFVIIPPIPSAPYLVFSIKGIRSILLFLPERAIVDVETLQKTNRNIIETLDKVIEIHENGRIKRQEAEKELLNIEKELKDKMIEIKVNS